MKTTIFSLSLVIILILAGCKDNSTQTIDTSVIWPLKVGNFWDYQEYSYDQTGDRFETRKFHFRVFSDTLINGINMKNVNVQIEDIDPWNYTIQYQNNEQGFCYYRNDSLRLGYKYPANKNDFFIRDGDSVFVLSINEKITVPSGSFNCNIYFMPIRRKGYSANFYEYFSPGVGLIKQEIYEGLISENLKISVTKELLSFKIN